RSAVHSARHLLAYSSCTDLASGRMPLRRLRMTDTFLPLLSFRKLAEQVKLMGMRSWYL
ncbi:uncharacterized protein L969DRAFT_50385, partial [Mixia osmundae IAM 14324]|uniref:uncharacterized protein n=1 Tax=Mixia osmundae (strain CBS 9802 / IAM 14324 / JCM 22182 / KY 12970) TaxID=764103 RepID=UPI0004A54D60